MIVEKIVVGRMDENCYLVGDPKALLVIDPGDEAETILSRIREENYQVKYVVLTHCHYDHIGAVSAILEETGAEFVMAEKERDNYFNRGVTLCGYFAPKPTLCEPSRLVTDGEVIKAGAYQFRIIETPGHTGGSICLLGENHLFSGDTLFHGSIGRADFPTGSLKELVASIKEKLFTLPEETVVHAGHGDDSTIGFEKVYNEVYYWEKRI